MSIDLRRQSFVSDVMSRHGSKLRRYFAARLRNATDVADLAQEVFLRLLRVDRHDKIRSPEAYLFTIASHVLAQHSLDSAAAGESIDIADPAADQLLAFETDYATEIDLRRRASEMELALERLPPNPLTCLILHCQEGWTLDEIALHLGISRSMVKKHIAKAVLLCRQSMQAPE